MSEEELVKSLGALPRRAHERGPDCPDEHELAAAVAGRLGHGARRRFEGHAADCSHCLARLAEVASLRSAAPEEPVPAHLLERAATLAAGAGRRRHAVTPVRGGWLAAASVVLALGLALAAGSQLERDVPPPGTQARIPAGDARSTRAIDRELARPKILYPRAGDVMRATGESIRWTPVTGSLYYDVHLVTDDGEIVWQERVTEPFVSLPPSLLLEPGTDYYLRVDAYLAEAMSVSSPHVPFMVRR